MSFRKYLAALAAIVLFGVSAVADATTMLFLSREELVNRSDLVARVRVGKAVTTESEDGRGLVTRTELDVVQLLKGKPDGRVVVQQFGGTNQGKTQKVLGDGALKPGEDAVVFLRRDEKGKLYFTALALSVYHVDAKGMAERKLDGVELVRYVGKKMEPSGHVERPEPVESLMTDVVRLAGGK
jgi:hypothetical protein